MWIERLQFNGFGTAFDERVDFGHNALSVVEEQSEPDELLIPAAVLAILYGFDPNANGVPDTISDIAKFRPKSDPSTSFSASMDCIEAGRRMRIIRSFPDGKLTVLERGREKRDITSEFIGEDGDQLGSKLTKLSRSEFVAKCMFIASKESAVKGEATWTALNNALESSSQCYGKAAAVNVLADCLNHFSYKSVKVKIDFLIDELDRQNLELRRKVDSLKGERAAMIPLLSRLPVIQPELDAETKNSAGQEYFQLCLRAAEIDGQVLQLRAHQVRLNNINRELAQLGSMEGFPIELAEAVEDLWLTRVAKLEDLRRFEREIAPSLQEYELREREITQRWGRLQSFVPEQVESIKIMAERFVTVEGELQELKQMRGDQQSVVASANIDLSRFEEARQTVQALDARDANDAKAYCALVAGFRKQLSSAERSKQRAEAIIKEIEAQRRSQVESNAVLKVFKPSNLRQSDLEVAQSEVQRQVARIEDVQARIRNLQLRIDTLAKRAGIQDGNKLIEDIQAQASAGLELQELDRLDSLITQQELSRAKLKSEFAPYFKQAGRLDGEIDAKSASQLAQDLSGCMGDLKSLNKKFNSFRSVKQQLDILSSEVRSTEQLLAESFARARVEDPSNLETSYTEFYARVAQCHHWRALMEDLERAKNRYSFAQGLTDVRGLVTELEMERYESWQRIHELVDNFPEIGDQSPPLSPVFKEESSQSQPSKKQVLLQERDNLTKQLKGFFDHYDEYYANLLSRIVAVERELTLARNSKLSLELAREVLEQLLIEELTKLLPDDAQGSSSEQDSLPLIIHAASLTQEDLEISLVLRFLISVIVPKRQIILLNNSRKLNLAKFSPLLKASPVPINFVWRKPVKADAVGSITLP
jgi:hypothetical protein